VIFVVDEAHLLSPDQLEELRLLTNAEFDSASLFAAILVGQPTLARQLRLGIFAALDQRIATRYTLPPMDLAESAAYLRHHLALAGRTDALFGDDAVARLHRVANPPTAKPWSTTPAPSAPSPNSPATDRPPSSDHSHPQRRSPASGRRCFAFTPRWWSPAIAAG
jgi:hypothetical protein